MASLAETFTKNGRPHRAVERQVVPVGPPGLRLRFYSGVPADVRNTLKAFACWLRKEIDFCHPVRVTVVPHVVVAGYDLDDLRGCAVLVEPDSDYETGEFVRIFVGGGAADALEFQFGYVRAAALATIAHNLGHEVVHYTQWRDRGRVYENGVYRRTGCLVRTWITQNRPFEGIAGGELVHALPYDGRYVDPCTTPALMKPLCRQPSEHHAA